MRLLNTVAFIAIYLGFSAQAFAHTELPSQHPLAWSFEPWVLFGLALASIGYAIGTWRLRNEVGAERIFDRWRIMSFAAGMTVLFLALSSPIDTMGDQLFSAHMLQHILLMMVAPPLLVWSRPALALLWAFSPSGRKRIGRIWLGLGLDRVFKALMHPLSVFMLFCGAFIFWHLPRIYEWGLRSDYAHAAEHLSFLLSSLAFWTIIIEPSGRRRLDYGSTLLFLVVTVIVSDLPGALMVLAPRPLYPLHAEGAAAWGMTPMQDQQVAGLIMWIPAGAIYIAAAIWLFIKLLDQAELRATRLRRYTAIVVASMLLPLILGGCGDQAKSSEANLGNVQHGAELITGLGCGTCHIVPGIDGAVGLVGPPLDHVGARTYIAGVLRNTPDNMVTWLRHPQAVVPNNAMPDMGLGESDARDITAYLNTLN